MTAAAHLLSARARDRAARRATLPILLGRLDRLSPAERDLLREYVTAELADADEIDAMRRGLDRHRQEQLQRLTAAEAAIVEAEQDRDQAREQLAQAETELGPLRHRLEAAQDDRAHALGEARETRGLLNAALARIEQLAQAQRWGAVWKSHVLAVDERADRHHAAWRSARLRARRTETELERRGGWLTHWADRARAAEPRLARVTLAWRSARRRARTAEAALAHIRTPHTVKSGHPMYALLDAMIGPGIDQVTAREHVGRYFRAITQQEPTP